MAGATYVLDKTYRITSAGGVGKYLAVVTGTNDGDCQLPASASQLAYGLTQESQPNQNENVIVRKYGISRAVANSPDQQRRLCGSGRHIRQPCRPPT